MSDSLTVDSLRAILGREVEEIHLTIAKSNALGLDPEIIANTIGIERAEVEELMLSQDYKDVRLLVGSEMLTAKLERDSSWDGIESDALVKLKRRVTLENDTDTLLRIAAVANRAQRRTAPPKESGPLDPSNAGARVPLTLTKRYTEKLGSDGTVTRSLEQQISVLNGSAVNPKFEDVKVLLSGNGGADVARGDAELLPASPKTTEALRDRKSAAQGLSESDESWSMSDLLKAAQKGR